jgi:peptide/nickel transport system permease protein
VSRRVADALARGRTGAGSSNTGLHGSGSTGLHVARANDLVLRAVACVRQQQRLRRRTVRSLIAHVSAGAARRRSVQHRNFGRWSFRCWTAGRGSSARLGAVIGPVSFTTYVIRRVAGMAFAVIGVTVVTFVLIHVVPGDPVDNLAGGDVTPEQRAEMMACMNLDQPLVAQFATFARNVANGSLGRQCPDPARNRPPVSAKIFGVLPHTAELAIGAIVVAIVLALPLGVVAALKRGSWVDATTSVLSLAGVSIPIMWLGPLVIFVFFVKLAWIPGPGEPNAPLALLMPSVVLGTHLMALIARMTRASLIDVLGEEYMQTARAKGLAPWTVILRHGLRNAIMPVITVVGLQFGSLLAGATITEMVFARPGIGTLVYQAIRERNYPVIQASVLVVAVLTIAVNFMVDLSYGVVDPRVRRA